MTQVPKHIDYPRLKETAAEISMWNAQVRVGGRMAYGETDYRGLRMLAGVKLKRQCKLAKLPVTWAIREYCPEVNAQRLQQDIRQFEIHGSVAAALKAIRKNKYEKPVVPMSDRQAGGNPVLLTITVPLTARGMVTAFRALPVHEKHDALVSMAHLAGHELLRPGVLDVEPDQIEYAPPVEPYAAPELDTLLQYRGYQERSTTG